MGVLIHSTPVGQEVLENDKLDLDRPIGHDFRLNFRHLRRHPINSMGIMPVLLVTLLISWNTLLNTVRRMRVFGTGTILPRLMMVTGCQLIGIAITRSIVEPTSHQSMFIPIIHRIIRIPSSTAVTTPVATSQHVGSRNSSLKSLATVDTNTVRNDLYCTERPTRSTVSLVSDLFYRFAVGPLLCRKKLLWDCFQRFDFLYW